MKLMVATDAHLFKTPERLKVMAENAYNYGKENYSSYVSTAKLMDIFEKVRRH